MREGFTNLEDTFEATERPVSKGSGISGGGAVTVACGGRGGGGAVAAAATAQSKK